MNGDQPVGIHTAHIFRRGKPDETVPIFRRDRAPTAHLGDRARLKAEFTGNSGVPAKFVDDVADIVHVDQSTRFVSACQHYSCRRSRYDGEMNEMSDRLRQARLKAGFTSAAKASDAMGLKASTYRAHENGQNEFDKDEARFYARRLGCDFFWLLTGIPQGEISEDRQREIAASLDADDIDDTVLDPVSIPEIDLRAGAGAGGVELVSSTASENGYSISADAIRDRWSMPESFTRGELRMAPGGAYVTEVYGDSGYDPSNPHAPGSVHAGDRVIIDTTDRRPSPPGLFAVYDGMGLVLKLVEIVRGSDPAKIRLSSRNPSYSAYEAVEGEAVIIGRVRGRISAM